MNFEQYASEHWNKNLYTFIKEALSFYQMKSRIESESVSEDGAHLYLASIAEENMLSRLVGATGAYEDIEAAFDGKVIRDY
ncbi:hypothetical protein KP77_11450 [Jeotgalibacillus alimentarius]|uniref:Uncharacterized protein n=1 Tax=Jeotgalibacillus alimentarius TaxID=135826 RepID=A0A0C2W6H9_9BACL|nr:DUF6407 family protein [Jeotgalibacillus alimentarius]KIL51633.1 hypothetical protein KP77_11450 [Jeotgalibacillus alimentarius]